MTATRFVVAAKAERTLGYHFEIAANGRVFTIDLIGLLRRRTEVLLTAFGPKGSYVRTVLDPFAALLAQRLAARA